MCLFRKKLINLVFFNSLKDGNGDWSPTSDANLSSFVGEREREVLVAESSTNKKRMKLKIENK